MKIAALISVLTSVLPAQETPKIDFLDPARAREAIVDDRDEPYFSLLRPHDMSAKIGRPVPGATIEEQRDTCRRAYREAAADFSDTEKDLVRTAVARIHPVLAADYPKFAALPWSFIKVGDSIEGGFPHTRGPHIVLPAGTLAGMARTLKRSERDALFRAATLLAHEQVHVFQRKYPDSLDALYTGLWGFRRAPRIEGCPWLDRHEVVNPDATDVGWVFPFKEGGKERVIWPRVLFKDPEPGPGEIFRMGEDFRMAAVELEKTPDGYRVSKDAAGNPAMADLMKVRPYTEKFPGESYIYHPEEAAAAYFGTIAAVDALVDKERLPEESRRTLEKNLDPVRGWFRRIFGDRP